MFHMRIAEVSCVLIGLVVRCLLLSGRWSADSRYAVRNDRGKAGLLYGND